MDTGNTSASRLARFPMLKAITLMLTLAVLLMSGRGALAANAPAPGVNREGEYEAVQFMWQVLWERPWKVDKEMTASEPGQYDRLVLHKSDATIRIIFDFDQDPAAALDTYFQVTNISTGGATVLGTDSGTDGFGWPYVSATLSYYGLDSNGTDEPTIEYVEVGPALTTDMNYGVHLTSLIAPEAKFESAFASAQKHVVSNLSQAGNFFVGKPAGIPAHNDGAAGGSTDGQLSADEYLAGLTSQLDTLAASIDDFQTVLQSPTLGDEASINKLTAILDTWIASFNTAQAIVPPSGYEEVHQLYLDFTAFLSGAATDIYQGNLDAATQKLEYALTMLKELESTLGQGSGDILNRKSG